jgi:hypothetical protein
MRMISVARARVRPWVVVTTAATAALLLSLALPWTSEWNDRRTPGASVLLFSDDHQPHLGVVLLALWGMAVIGAARGTRAWWWLAMACAAGVVAICPVYYATAITAEGLAIGRDAAGNLVEWEVRSRVAAGFQVAAIGSLLLCTGVLMRCRSAGFGRTTDRDLSP